MIKGFSTFLFLQPKLFSSSLYHQKLCTLGVFEDASLMHNDSTRSEHVCFVFFAEVRTGPNSAAVCSELASLVQMGNCKPAILHAETEDGNQIRCHVYVNSFLSGKERNLVVFSCRRSFKSCLYLSNVNALNVSGICK